MAFTYGISMTVTYLAPVEVAKALLCRLETRRANSVQ
jgi:hypothetical protein